MAEVVAEDMEVAMEVVTAVAMEVEAAADTEVILIIFGTSKTLFTIIITLIDVQD